MPRKPELTDEEIRLKALTRELHEAAKVARAAAKELAAAREDILVDVHKLMTAATNERVEEINAHLLEGQALMEGMHATLQQAIAEATAMILGHTTQEAAIDQVARMVKSMTGDREFVLSVANQVINILSIALERAGTPKRMVPEMIVAGLRDVVGDSTWLVRQEEPGHSGRPDDRYRPEI